MSDPEPIDLTGLIKKKRKRGVSMVDVFIVAAMGIGFILLLAWFLAQEVNKI